MPFKIVVEEPGSWDGPLVRPTAICDECGSEITNAQIGSVIYDEEGLPYPLRSVNCFHRFETSSETSVGVTSFSDEMEEFPTYLSRNVGMPDEGP